MVGLMMDGTAGSITGAPKLHCSLWVREDTSVHPRTTTSGNPF